MKARVLLACAVAAGCSDGGYRVQIVMPDDFERALAASVDLAVLRPGGCERIDGPGGQPAVEDTFRTIEVDPLGPSEAVGRLDEGRWGFAAWIRDAGCEVVLAGCVEENLEVGGAGTIRVETSAVDGPGCAAAERCEQGRCRDPCERDAECDDGIACTMDLCRNPPGTCVRLADHEVCDDGELCDEASGCTAGPDCSADEECDDGNACNGLEACTGARCAAGEPIDCGDAETCDPDLGCVTTPECLLDSDCDDAVDCTEDRCVDPDGKCSVVPDDGSCAGTERCDAILGCVPRAPCSDHGDCDDGDRCNGLERCEDDLCASGEPLDCDDEDDCTVDLCDADDGCDHLPIDTDGDGAAGAACGGTDCDDHDATVWPGADDATGDGVDQNCDGADGVDADGDGAASIESGGGDCDDGDPERYPGAEDNAPAWLWDDAVEIPNPDGTAKRVSIAVAPDGLVQVVFGHDDHDDGDGERELRRAKGEETFVVDTVESLDSEPEAVIAVDDSGAAHVSYFASAGNDLRYSTDSSGTWDAVRAIEAGTTGRDPAIAVAGGVVHVACRDNAGELTLRYARSEDDEFVEDQGAQDIFGLAASIAVDSTGAPAISHCDTTGWGDALRVVSNRSGQWSVTAVAETCEATSTSIAVAAGDVLHVLYEDAGEVRHAVEDADGAWSSEAVDRGEAPSLTIDADDLLHVAYRDGGSIWHAFRGANGWQTSAIANADDRSSTSIVAGPDGRIHVAFLNGGVFHAATLPGTADGVDQDCDGVDGVDQDGDGFASRSTGGDDCNDGDPAIWPAAPDPNPGDYVDARCGAGMPF